MGLSKRANKVRSSIVSVSPTLYQPLDFMLVRAPLLPFEAYLALSRGEPSQASVDDPSVQRALAVGSAELLNELERVQRGGRNASQAQRKLLRYLIRMSTRPTPFGLFAGVALGHWGARTNLAIATACGATRTRPDMGWLLQFIKELEADPAVRKQLRFVAHTGAVVRAGRVFLAERAPRGASGVGPEVSLRATRPVLQALALAREPIAYADLVAALAERFPNVAPAKLDQLVADLWEQTLLLTDLCPPLTTDNPAHWLARRLAEVPAAAAARAELEAMLTAIAAWDALPPAAGAEAYRELYRQARAMSGVQSETPFMVDMALALDGRHIHAAVGAEAARAAEILLRLTPLPDGMPFLTGYRRAFEAKYGHDREIPLLELLDPNIGLGAPVGYSAAPALPPAKSAQRAQTLLDLALTAIRERRQVVELDGETLARLETWAPSQDTAPLSLDLYVFVAASSVAVIDEGAFQIVVGPNLGAMAAGRNLGRFADMLAPEATAALRRAAEAEAAHHPARLAAELVYFPRSAHAANVVIRPPIRPYEIVIGASPGVPHDRAIPLDELVVGTRNGRFYLRWTARDVEVAVGAGHMLNHFNAPPIARFLSEISRDGVAQLSSFDWGPATNFPFHPRVQVGRIVLAPAEWRIDSRLRQRELAVDTLPAFRAALVSWRAQWQVPRFVALTIGDNRLLLDLDDEQQIDELRAEIRSLPDSGALLLQEMLPAPDQVWLSGSGGHFVTELVVSLTLKPRPETQAPVIAAPKATARRITHVGEDLPKRLRPPGSEWLFAKLYGPRVLEDDLIAGPLLDFAEEMCAAGLAEAWFFIRYSDPDPHIRLRFRGAPQQLTADLIPRLCAWAAALMDDGTFLRFSIDTYDRELERYGAEDGMAAAESIFAVDSRAVAHLLRLIQERALVIDRTILAVLTIDDLLAGLGLDEHERLGWYRESAYLRHETGIEYRQRKALLRSLLGDPYSLLSQPGGEAVTRILAARRKALAPIAARLAELAERSDLTQSLAMLYRSYVHLHVNRLLGADNTAEGRMLGLLVRTREGLERAPGAHGAGPALGTTHEAER